MSPSRTAILVLGMHRSGTSSVAGSLAILGASVPRTLMKPAADNPKGFWESEILTAFNDRLLAACGSSWHDWRACNTGQVGAAIQTLKAEARSLVDQEFGAAEVIALKDPRICRLLPFWREVLEAMGFRVVAISPIRPPAEVAASLMARNSMSRSHALRLWMRHVMDAEHFSRDLPRVFMSWDGLLADWRGQLVPQLARLNVDLELTSEKETAMDDFLSTDLKHQTNTDQVPAWVSNTHTHLLGLCAGEDDAYHSAELGHLRNGFNAAAPLFLDAPT